LGDLSCRTVQTFRENIKRKLNVDTFQQLFSLIQNSGIMTILVN
jgi:DNA-binding CsgD family transcriptional regulator